MRHSGHGPRSDLDIAEYVLGLASTEEAAAIQAWLAQDNAAAACALKWEAYLLEIADGLPGVPPPPGLQARIQATLGFADGAAEAPVMVESRAADAPRPRRTRARRAPRLRRGRVAAVAAVLVGVILAAVLGMALLRPAPQQQTERALQLAPVNPALPASQPPAR